MFAKKAKSRKTRKLPPRENFHVYSTTPGIRPNASGAATVSPDGKQVGKNFITNLIMIIKVCYLLYIL